MTMHSYRLIGALAAVSLIGSVVILFPLFQKRDGYDPNQAARTQLDILAEKLLAYEVEHGGFPNSRAEFLRLYSEDGTQLVDYWGSPIPYITLYETPVIYSFGENQIDDEGSGDDVLPSIARFRGG